MTDINQLINDLELNDSLCLALIDLSTCHELEHYAHVIMDVSAKLVASRDIPMTAEVETFLKVQTQMVRLIFLFIEQREVINHPPAAH